MGQKSWDACNKNKPNFETSFNKKKVDKVIDKVDNLWHNLLFFQFNSMRTAIKSRLQLNEAKQPIKNVEKYSRGRQADGGLYAGEGGHPPLMPRCLCGPLVSCLGRAVRRFSSSHSRRRAWCASRLTGRQSSRVGESAQFFTNLLTGNIFTPLCHLQLYL